MPNSVFLNENYDLDELKTPGIYNFRENTVNAPLVASGSVLVMSSNYGSHVLQILWHANSKAIYARTRTESNWINWEQIHNFN